MANERLRAALIQRGQTPHRLAEAVGVDPKTVERWITKGRVPYPSTRYQVASLLESDDSYLWPDAVSLEQLTSVSHSEIVAVYPHRGSVPHELWGQRFSSAEREIGILVYSGLFLLEDAGIQTILRSKADAGVRIRILLGDPHSAAIRERGADEGIDDALSGKIRNVMVLLKSLMRLDSIEVRWHATTLYNSIYRADEEVLINTHIYGAPASQAPVMHLRQVGGGNMVSTYLESFERVWDTSRPPQTGT